LLVSITFNSLSFSQDMKFIFKQRYFGRDEGGEVDEIFIIEMIACCVNVLASPKKEDE
jgi:hypothetical protein